MVRTQRRESTSIWTRRSARSRGEVGVGTIVFILLLIVIAYGCYKFIPPYVRYSQIKYLFQEQAARAKVTSVDKIRRTIWERFERLDTIWLEQDDLVVKMERDRIIIKAEYEEVIEFPGGYEYSIWFEPSIIEAISTKRFF